MEIPHHFPLLAFDLHYCEESVDGLQEVIEQVELLGVGGRVLFFLVKRGEPHFVGTLVVEVDEDKKQQERTQQSAYISEGIDDFLVASGDDDGGGVSKEADESVDISAVSQTVGVGRHRSDDGAILDMLRGKRQYTFICRYQIACIINIHFHTIIMSKHNIVLIFKIEFNIFFILWIY